MTVSLQKWIPQKRWQRRCAYLINGLLIALACDLLLVRCWRQITISADTTRLTAPLNAAGQIDYLAVINQHAQQGVTPENNAGPLILTALGPREMLSRIGAEAHARELGVDLLADPHRAFIPYGDYLPDSSLARAQNSADFLAPLDQTLWTDREHPVIARWLDENRVALDLFVQASDRPKLYLPLFPPPQAPSQSVGLYCTIGLGEQRQALAALSCRAMRRLQAGDEPGFATNALAVLKLARLLNGQPTLVHRLLALSANTIGAHAIAAAATSGKLSAAQAEKLRDAMHHLGLLAMMDDVLDTTKRYSALACISASAKYGIASPDGVAGIVIHDDTFNQLVSLEPVLPIHYNQALRQVNAFFDQYVAALREPTWSRRHAAMVAAELTVVHAAMAFDSRGGLLLHTEDYLAVPVSNPLGRVGDLIDQARMEQKLAEVALALAAYHADHNTYPPHLDDLQPAYIPEVPLDLPDDTPLHYTLTPHGYLLYSVGINGRDDGGKSNGPADDLAIRAGSTPDHPTP